MTGAPDERSDTPLHAALRVASRLVRGQHRRPAPADHPAEQAVDEPAPRFDETSSPRTDDPPDRLPHHPYLRIGSLGHVPWWPAPTAMTDLTTNPRHVEQLGLDIVLLPGPSQAGPSELDAATRDVLIRCEQHGVPTVLVASLLEDLSTPLADLCRGVVATDPAVAAEAERRFGPNRAHRVPVAIDIRRFNPMGRRSGSRHVLVLEGADQMAINALRERGHVTHQLGSHATEGTELRELGMRAIAALAPAGGGDEDTQRTAVALSAMGVPVVSSTAPPALDDLVFVAPAKDVGDLVTSWAGDPEAAMIASVGARRAAHRNRSVTDAVSALLAAAGIPRLPPPSVSLLVTISDLAVVAEVERNVLRQDHPRLQAVLVTDHQRGEQLQAAVSGWSIPTRVAAMDAAATRGDRLNLAAHLATGHLVGILDEHGLYGPGHVTDLIAALTYTGAQLVGRSDRFVYDRNRDITARIAPGTTDRPQSRLALGTLMLRRESALRCGFARDEDAIDRSLIASMERSGGTAESIHPFESLLPGRLDPARADQNDRATPGRDIARVLPFGDGGHPPATEPT